MSVVSRSYGVEMSYSSSTYSAPTRAAFLLFSTIASPLPPKRFSRDSSRYPMSNPETAQAAPNATMLRMIAPPASSASRFSGTSSPVVSPGASKSDIIDRSPS